MAYLNNNSYIDFDFYSSLESLFKKFLRNLKRDDNYTNND